MIWPYVDTFGSPVDGAIEATDMVGKKRDGGICTKVVSNEKAVEVDTPRYVR